MTKEKQSPEPNVKSPLPPFLSILEILDETDVILDNKRKIHRELPQNPDFTVFYNQEDQKAPKITPQLSLAIFQVPIPNRYCLYCYPMLFYLTQMNLKPFMRPIIFVNSLSSVPLR